MKLSTLILALCFVMGISSWLYADLMPVTEAFMTVDGGTPISLPLDFDEKGVGYVDNFMLTSAGNWQVTINAELNPDPDILYAIAVADFGAPSTFSFTFSQPIVLTAAPGLASNTHSSSTTNVSGPNTPVTALPPPGGVPTDGAPTEIVVYTLSTNGGATLLNAGMDLSPSFVEANPSDVQGPFNEGPIAGPAGAGFYNFMRVDINFGMAGGGDLYTFNGLASIVPEPSSISLVGAGLLGLLAFGRRRNAR